MFAFLLQAGPSLAKLRDLAIIGTAINYVIGYTVVAIYAVTNGFGFLRALDTQYIVAGLIPSLLLLALLLDWLVANAVGRSLAALAEAKLELQRLKSSSGLAQYLVLLAHLFAALAPTIVLGVISSSIYGDSKSTWRVGIGGSGLVFALTFMFGVFWGLGTHRGADPDIGVRRRRSKLAALLNRGFEISLTALAMLVGAGPMIGFLFWTYATKVFPAIPPELGGGASRCTTVVIKDETLRTALLGTSDRSLRLRLELAGDPFVFSRPAEPTDGVSKSVWLIPQSAVLALGPCAADKAT